MSLPLNGFAVGVINVSVQFYQREDILLELVLMCCCMPLQAAHTVL